MGIAGSINPGGGAPRPDPERVATLRYTLVDEAETCAAFGEAARAALADLNDRALAETSGAALDEAALLVARIRDCVANLDPARLEPRRGLGGLFDSRSKRLKAFRATFQSTSERVAATAADLGGRTTALSTRETALDALWSQTRDAIADLDTHIAAARDWLTQDVHPTPEPAPEPSPDASDEEPPAEAVDVTLPVDADTEPPTSEPQEETVADSTDHAEAAAQASVPEPEPEPQPEAEPASPPPAIEALPHPLRLRLNVLESVRAAAIARLPQIRAAQNADWRTPAALRGACEAVQSWQDDWRTGLGLAGKKPKKIRPDGAALRTASAALADRIAAAEYELSLARARRAEIRLAA